jgi:hypothetical protein
VVEATLARLEKLELLKAARAAAGSLRREDYPHWSTPEKASAWVRQLREESDSALSEGEVGPVPPRYLDPS